MHTVVGSLGSDMPESIETAKVKLITVIAGEELLDGVEENLRKFAASGFTISRAEGRGHHGLRKRDFFSLANVRVEVLLRPAEAARLLEHLARVYHGRQLIVFSHDVEAVPKEHFE
jgi:nitrogen regulatory protein PII